MPDSDGEYLLTSDFLHNRFSLVARFESGRRTAISFLFEDGVDEIAIGSEANGVTSGGQQVDLPAIIGKTFVEKRGRQGVVLESSDGLKVQCNGVYHVCSVTISGFYFGKTGGLLGVYDNEPSNDMMTSTRAPGESDTEFVDSWRIRGESDLGGVCEREPSPIIEDDSCSRMFAVSSESALMPCFDTLDPAPFADLCFGDGDGDGSHCRAAAAYVELCRLRQVELWLPAECTACQNHDGSRRLSGGESLNYRDGGDDLAPQAADVVFVVQQGTCLRSLLLGEIPAEIERLLVHETPIQDVSFAVVGYGGPGKLDGPQVFTFGGDIFMEKNQAATVLERLFKVHGSRPGIFSSLQFAGRLPFRPGVSKAFVAVTCTTTVDDYDDYSNFNYGDALTMIREQGITLHHLTGEKFGFRQRKKSAEKILGYSSEAVYFPGTTSRGLRRHLRPPKDLLSALASETEGSVFQQARLESPTTRSEAMAAMARHMAESLADPHSCQVCDCLTDINGQGQLHCHKCILPEIDVVLRNVVKLRDLSLQT